MGSFFGGWGCGSGENGGMAPALFIYHYISPPGNHTVHTKAAAPDPEQPPFLCDYFIV